MHRSLHIVSRISLVFYLELSSPLPFEVWTQPYTRQQLKYSRTRRRLLKGKQYNIYIFSIRSTVRSIPEVISNFFFSQYLWVTKLLDGVQVTNTVQHKSLFPIISFISLSLIRLFKLSHSWYDGENSILTVVLDRRSISTSTVRTQYFI